MASIISGVHPKFPVSAKLRQALSVRRSTRVTLEHGHGDLPRSCAEGVAPQTFEAAEMEWKGLGRTDRRLVYEFLCGRELVQFIER